MKLNQFQASAEIVKFVRTIDHLFEILNSRNPLGRGFKQPGPSAFRQRNLGRNFEIYCEIDTRIKTHANIQQLLSPHSRKIGKIIGFVASIKSTIEMANEMFTSIDQPIKYLLAYKFSQDHIDLLFSCIRAKGGWNNNPNCLQLKYAIRKMMLRNAVTASKNANCQTFSNYPTTIIPFISHKETQSPFETSYTR
jgi:hypothetical protein